MEDLMCGALYYINMVVMSVLINFIQQSFRYKIQFNLRVYCGTAWEGHCESLQSTFYRLYIGV